MICDDPSKASQPEHETTHATESIALAPFICQICQRRSTWRNYHLPESCGMEWTTVAPRSPILVMPLYKTRVTRLGCRVS